MINENLKKWFNKDRWGKNDIENVFVSYTTEIEEVFREDNVLENEAFDCLDEGTEIHIY